MALSNRDRIGRAFELLAAGLAPYVERRMRATSRTPDAWLSEFAESARPPIRGEASANDPALLLRMMVEAWNGAFRDELKRADRTIADELRGVRNRWAHNDAFSVDDAYRALDSIERLLVSIDATQAAEVGRSKEDLMRLRFEAQAKKAVPAPEALLTEPAAGLKPWREVIEPHDDVARGRFALAEFAADLHEVSQGEGAEEYRDPIAFFHRTFLTAGLRKLLSDAALRITGAGGQPVVDLQTSFGGGKTHSMIALHHLLSGTPVEAFPQDVQDLLAEAGVTELPPVERAVLVGTELKPGQVTVHDDGTETGTLWGELAWQLGGAEGYALVAESDRSRSNPGDALRDLFRAHAPCLVLIDEWVAYARGLYSDDTLRGGTLDTQLTFAQALTQAASNVPGVLLVASIPSSAGTDEEGMPIGSEHEIGGVGGREALRRLRAVIARKEDSWRPATAEESFEIVRRRLFQEIGTGAAADRDATAKVFGSMYRKNGAEFPPGCGEKPYEERIKAAYPIHPELFARLYEDWSTLERFQRTRGVLRLMATVVHALWAGGDQAPIILPASVPLSDPAVLAELTRNLDDAWKPIIDTDVDGPGSLPRSLDDEVRNLGRYGATRRVARTVFLGSAPLAGTPNQGLDAPRVRLGSALPGETLAIYADALSRMADRGTYFFSDKARYWYGTQAGVTRVARDRSERLLAGDRHEAHDHIITCLQVENERAHRGLFAAVHAAPEGPADVADTPSTRLVILKPTETHSTRVATSDAEVHAAEILSSRGAAPRQYRNMLVFLAPDTRAVGDLEHAVADLLAWESVVEDAESLGLDRHQEAQANERMVDAERTVGLRLASTYHWVLTPRQPEPTGEVVWEDIKADGPGSLAARAGEKLKHAGGLYEKYPPVLLRLQMDGSLRALWSNGDVAVNDVWDAYARYLYLHRLCGIDTLCAAVAAAPGSTTWEEEGVAVAQAKDDSGRYLDLAAGAMADGVVGTSLIVNPAIAERQRIADANTTGFAGGSVLDGDADSDPAPGPGSTVERPSPPQRRRWFGVISIDPARLGSEAARINTEVLAHLNGLDGAEMEIAIEVRATRSDGFPDDVARIVDENANALRFDPHGFEDT